MNWWMVAGGMMALICAAGHAIVGRSTFYQPIKSDLRSELLAGVFTGMWHIITINFTASAIALSRSAPVVAAMRLLGSSRPSLLVTPRSISSHRCVSAEP